MAPDTVKIELRIIACGLLMKEPAHRYFTKVIKLVIVALNNICIKTQFSLLSIYK